MSVQERTTHADSDVLKFLCVDDFVSTLVDARALKTAFELGLVDHLLMNPEVPLADLQQTLGLDQAGMQLLIGMLGANRVLLTDDVQARLHPDFLTALQYRDLLETRLDFAGILMNDFADLFTTLIRDPAGFAGSARLFELFDYRRCLELTNENYARTSAWMRLTSALTRYEAPVCMQLYDFSGHRRMLDVGGNSGEFVLRLCKGNPQLHGTVLDLPVVCEVGMAHVLSEPEQPRIRFIKSDVRMNNLPGGYDLISFKSMLHDWPQESALGFLDKAAAALEPGGSVLIFERMPIEITDISPKFSLLPILLFFRSYRAPSIYCEHLKTLGFEDISSRRIDLDSPFMLVTARKPQGH